MASARHQKMVGNLAALRRELLPKKFDPLGNYSDRVRARAAGYRLLAHAEIEQFLEDRCSEIAAQAIREWRSSRRPTVVIAGLLAFTERTVEPAPSSLVPPKPGASGGRKVEIDERILAIGASYNYVVRNNNGVKEPNLLSLLLPLGISTKKLDPTWLADMDSFGASRGLIAHSSIIRNSIDPANEYATIKRVTGPLRALDAELAALI